VKSEQGFAKDFVIRTTDGGQHWTIFPLMLTVRGKDPGIQAPIYSQPHRQTAMTRDSVGKLYRTTNGGKSWKQVGSFTGGTLYQKGALAELRPRGVF